MAEESTKRQRALGLSTIEAETAALQKAEDQRYQIELSAAQRINDLKKQAAAAEHRPAEGLTDLGVLGAEHDKRSAGISGASAEALKKEADEQEHMISEIAAHQREAYQKLAEEGQKTIQKIDEETVKGAERAAAESEKAEISHSERVFTRNKELIQQEFLQKQISIERKIELLKQQEQQEYRTAMASAGTGYQRAVKDHGSGSAEAEQAQARIQEIADRYAIVMDGLSAKTATIPKDLFADFNQALKGIDNAFDSSVAKWISGAEKFDKAIKQSIRSVEVSFIESVLKQTEHFIAGEAIKLAEKEGFDKALLALHLISAVQSKSVDSAKSIAEVASAASVGAASAGAAVAGIPIVGPALVAPTAAATFAQLMAFAPIASFDLGGVNPRTQMALIHGGERVLTQDQTKSLERGLAGSGGGGDTYHYHAGPNESPDSVAQNTEAFRRAVRDGRFQ
jgi:hypothetical protein